MFFWCLFSKLHHVLAVITAVFLYILFLFDIWICLCVPLCLRLEQVHGGSVVVKNGYFISCFYNSVLFLFCLDVLFICRKTSFKVNKQ